MAGNINVAYLLIRREKAVPEARQLCCLCMHGCLLIDTWKDENVPLEGADYFLCLSSALLQQ